MAEGQDARVQEIRNVIHACVAEGGAWLLDGGDAVTLLARLDALDAERDVLRVERDIARRVEQESSAAADAWQAEAVKVQAERDAARAWAARWKDCAGGLRRSAREHFEGWLRACDSERQMAARLAAAEAALAASKALIQSDLDMADERREVLAGIRAALAGSREQAGEGA